MCIISGIFLALVCQVRNKIFKKVYIENIKRISIIMMCEIKVTWNLFSSTYKCQKEDLV